MPPRLPPRVTAVDCDSEPVWRARTGTGARRWCLAAAAIATILLPTTLPAPAGAARPDPPTWADEFTGSALDLARWVHRATGDRHQGMLTPAAVAVADDLLTITTYTENGDHHSG